MTAALVALALAAAPAAPAAERDAAALAREVQAYYDRTKDLEARFVQTYTYAAFGRSQSSRGTLRVKKPGKLRWDYEAPSQKTVLVNGSKLVQWEPEVNQAYVDEHFDASGMSAALAFLLGKGDLEKEFQVSASSTGSLLLRPREPDPRVEVIELVARPDGQIDATRVVDGSGNVNEIELENVKRNTGIADSAFEVKLPEGVNRISPPGK